MNLTEKSIENDINKRIGAVKKNCIDDLKDIKVKLKDILDKEFIRLISESEIKRMPEYNCYLRDTSNANKSIDEFLKSNFISEEKKILYIAKYGQQENENENPKKFLKDLKDEKEYIKKHKQELKETAKRVLEIYDAIYKENEDEIKKIADEISKNEETIEKNKQKMSNIKLGNKQENLTEEQKENYNQLLTENTNLQKEIIELKEKKGKMENAQKIYKAKLDEFKENFKKEYGKITQDTIDGIDSNTKSENKTETNNSMIISNNAPNKNAKAREIAKAMWSNNNGVEKMDLGTLLEMINENGFQDIEDLKNNLGFFERGRLENKLKLLLDDEETIIFGKYTVNNYGELEQDVDTQRIYNIQCAKFQNDAEQTYRAALGDIRSFMKNIDKASPIQLDEFNKKIEILNIVMLYNGRKWYKGIGQYRKEKLIKKEIRNALAEYSRQNSVRQDNIRTKVNEIRQTLGYDRIQYNKRIKNLPKSGVDRIHSSTAPTTPKERN